MKQYDYLIVGFGLFGATFAYPYEYNSKIRDTYSTFVFNLLHEKVGLANDGDDLMVGFKNDGIIFD